MNFGYPISETQRLGFSFGVTDTKITAGQYAVQEIKSSPRLEPEVENWYESTLQADGTYAAAEVLRPIAELPITALTVPEQLGFLDLNGDEYLNFSVTGSWLQSTLNRGQLATRGVSQSVALAALQGPAAAWIAESRQAYAQAGREAAQALSVPEVPGGTFLFVDVADALDDRGLVGWLGDAADRGLFLSPGPSFGDYPTHVRVCFTCAPPDVTQRGIAVMKSLLARS